MISVKTERSWNMKVFRGCWLLMKQLLLLPFWGNMELLSQWLWLWGFLPQFNPYKNYSHEQACIQIGSSHRPTSYKKIQWKRTLKQANQTINECMKYCPDRAVPRCSWSPTRAALWKHSLIYLCCFFFFIASYWLKPFFSLTLYKLAQTPNSPQRLVQ